VDKCVGLVERCVAETGAELIVLPESASTGFTPGLPAADLWPLVDATVTAPIQEVAARLGLHIVFGTYQRGPAPGIVHNAAVLIGPAGGILATYHKAHLFA